MEEKLIFHPDARILQTPHDVGLAFTDVFFTTRDGIRLNGWFVPYHDSHRTLVWYHGNAGNISHRVENIRRLHHQVKINIFIFDYRGYGRSEGIATEKGTYLDGEAAIEYLRQHQGVDATKLVLFGRSLGAAVAAEMATRVDSPTVILESPFVSVREMAREIFPRFPIGFLLKTQYDIVDKIRRVKGSLLVLHGDRDEVVPFHQGQKVFDAAPQPKTFYKIVGAGHNDTFLVGGDSYFQALKSHIEQSGAMPR